MDDEKVPEEQRAEKQAFDSLPISKAITKIVKLFEERKCTFADFFHKKGRFHCFTGSPCQRKHAISELESEVKDEDIEESFYGEKAAKQSAQDTATKGNESSKEDAKVSELSEKFNNLDVSESSQNEVGETVEEALNGNDIRAVHRK